MTFYLGTHMPGWLAVLDVPLFVSRRRLEKRKRLPRAKREWALDSGGFSELCMYGEWRTTELEYVAHVYRVRDEIGKLQWAAPQDWMCEPGIIAGDAKLGWPGTKLSVGEHQRRTVENYLNLRAIAPDLPFIPALQGWEPGDYLRHVDQYAAAGVDLTREALVGLGSVCRRQHTREVEGLIWRLRQGGIKLHGLGFKKDGLPRVHDLLASADSLAWSYTARRRNPLPGCTHKSCANCPKYALLWREELLRSLQPGLFSFGAQGTAA
jgi:hypothetical protein